MCLKWRDFLYIARCVINSALTYLSASRLNHCWPKSIGGNLSALKSLIVGSAFLAATTAADAFAGQSKSADARILDRGRYILKIAGCNDCHTPGYAQAGGKIPEKQWLTGNELGWRGPWGTTYPRNLRLYMQDVSEEKWIKVAKTTMLRPPMPWFALHDMTTQDLRAIYRFIKYLGPVGEISPAFVPPEQEPKGPYVRIVVYGRVGSAIDKSTPRRSR